MKSFFSILIVGLAFILPVTAPSALLELKSAIIYPLSETRWPTGCSIMAGSRR